MHASELADLRRLKTAFEGAITVAIVLNISVMACDYWGIEQNALDIG